MSQQSQTPRNHTHGKLRVNVMGLYFELHVRDMFSILWGRKMVGARAYSGKQTQIPSRWGETAQRQVNICTLPQRGWNNIPNKTPEELPGGETWLQKCQSDQHLWEMLQRQEWHSELNPWKTVKRYGPASATAINRISVNRLTSGMSNIWETRKEHQKSWGCILHPDMTAFRLYTSTQYYLLCISSFFMSCPLSV